MPRSLLVRRALLLSAVSIAWSGIVGSVAVAAALGSGSLSLLGFGADALIDATASAALIWRFSVEARQPERAHRVEAAAERVIGVALVLLALYLAVSSVRSLAVEAHPEPHAIGVALLVASLIVLPLLARAKYRVAADLGSGALRADSVLTAAAAGLAAIGLASIGATRAFGFWWADAVAALIVSVIVAREGWASFRVSQAENP
jgi:divalent metal cation (Fe/Co/Zn/Cd) transporter